MSQATFQQASQEELLKSLQLTPKEISSKYFYDARGCDLFEQICELPEYYPTRTELSIMKESLDKICRAIGSHAVLIEYGSGASLKTRMLLDALPELDAYVPLDIAIDHLQDVADELRQSYPDLVVLPTHGDFTREVELPEEMPAGRRVVYFPGFTIGNLTSLQAVELLQRIHRMVGDHGGLLLGVDLVKDPSILEAAYNDSQGVTADFNRNALRHLNATANANFDIDLFDHVAFFNEAEQRIEMHLQSRETQTVAIGDQEIQIQAGERIRTELSHKYQRSTLEALCDKADLTVEQWWTDEHEWFAMAWITTADI